MIGIELTFPHTSCPKCGATGSIVCKRANRYGIYCKPCRKFIKWADSSETAVIKARIAYMLKGSK